MSRIYAPYSAIITECMSNTYLILRTSSLHFNFWSKAKWDEGRTVSWIFDMLVLKDFNCSRSWRRTYVSDRAKMSYFQILVWNDGYPGTGPSTVAFNVTKPHNIPQIIIGYKNSINTNIIDAMKAYWWLVVYENEENKQTRGSFQKGGNLEDCFCFCFQRQVFRFSITEIIRERCV